MYEGGGLLLICLQLTLATECPLWANISTSDSSATGMEYHFLLDCNIFMSFFFWFALLAGEDFEMIDVSLSFPSGSQPGDTHCINISIIEDLSFEKDEDFSVHVVSDPDADIDAEYTTVHIIDNDSTSLHSSYMLYRMFMLLLLIVKNGIFLAHPQGSIYWVVRGSFLPDYPPMSLMCLQNTPLCFLA